MEVVRLHRGGAPLIVSMPHVGTHIPADIADAMTPAARRVPDTDWHVDRLYGSRPASARPRSRRPIRATSSTSTARRTTSRSIRRRQHRTLSAHDLRLEPIYLPGQEPDRDETARRIETFWRPYHDTLAAEIDRLRGRHGHVLLWDGHSIRSRVARFFDGRLPDFNLGDADGATADAGLARRAVEAAEAEDAYTAAYNGRFKGGCIVRRFGKPIRGVHALQLELSQATYMEEAPPFRFLPEPAARVSAAIERIVGAVLDGFEAA